MGVIGIEHLHLFEMIDGLTRLGAETVCHASTDGPLCGMYEGWRATSERRAATDVIEDESLDLVVLAGVPADRGGHALAAVRAGQHVLAAKPAVTTLAELAELEKAASGEVRWWVFFSERLCNRAVNEAVRLVHAGAIGQLVAVAGMAPHTLAPESRPDWFFDPAQAGGILSDLATHQADQMLALTGAHTLEVVSAWVDNVATPQHPQFHDLGSMALRATTAHGHTVRSTHHVDWLTPTGLGTWGDVRLMLTGTEGTIEVRSNIDVAGVPGPEHLILVDATSARRIDCSSVSIDWSERLAADIANGSDTFVPHTHTVTACATALRAQQLAEASS